MTQQIISNPETPLSEVFYSRRVLASAHVDAARFQKIPTPADFVGVEEWLAANTDGRIALNYDLLPQGVVRICKAPDATEPPRVYIPRGLTDKVQSVLGAFVRPDRFVPPVREREDYLYNRDY